MDFDEYLARAKRLFQDFQCEKMGIEAEAAKKARQLLNVNMTDDDVDNLLQFLAECLLQPDCTVLIANYMRPIILDLVARAIGVLQRRVCDSIRNAAPVARAFARLVEPFVAPHALPLVVNYYKNAGSPSIPCEAQLRCRIKLWKL